MAKKDFKYDWYKDEDFIEIVDLLKRNDYRIPDSPEELNGMALVARKDGDIIGFVWALSAKDSPVAYVDHFVVDKSVRVSGVGINLLLVLQHRLHMEGVKKLLGVVPPGNTGYLRMLRKRNWAEIIPNYTVLVANAGPAKEVV